MKGIFSNLFTTSDPSGFDDILNNVLPMVSAEMNMNLNREYTENEVSRALQQMEPLTAPDPNGMSSVFYKTFWHIVGKEVTVVILAILNSGTILESLNTTFKIIGRDERLN